MIQIWHGGIAQIVHLHANKTNKFVKYVNVRSITKHLSDDLKKLDNDRKEMA